MAKLKDSSQLHRPSTGSKENKEKGGPDSGHASAFFAQQQQGGASDSRLGARPPTSAQLPPSSPKKGRKPLPSSSNRDQGFGFGFGVQGRQPPEPSISTRDLVSGKGSVKGSRTAPSSSQRPTPGMEWLWVEERDLVHCQKILMRLESNWGDREYAGEETVDAEWAVSGLVILLAWLLAMITPPCSRFLAITVIRLGRRGGAGWKRV